MIKQTHDIEALLQTLEPHLHELEGFSAEEWLEQEPNICLTDENGAGNLTLAITTDTLRWGSSTGSRTIAANGTATLLKVTSTVWRLTGDGIT